MSELCRCIMPLRYVIPVVVKLGYVAREVGIVLITSFKSFQLYKNLFGNVASCVT